MELHPHPSLQKEVGQLASADLEVPSQTSQMSTPGYVSSQGSWDCVLEAGSLSTEVFVYVACGHLLPDSRHLERWVGGSH